MKLYLYHDGQQSGPFPLEEIQGMLRAGQARPTDYVWHQGVPDWIPLSAYLESLKPKSSLRLTTQGDSPPPIPATSNAPPVQAPPLAGANSALLPAGLSIADLEREIEAGGRFVIFQYCISVLVMTFKRASSIVFLRGREDGFGQAFGYSMISLVAGWWGFPWGPIWTIGSLVTNAGGGKDVTREVLTEVLGPARASAVLTRRQPPSKGRLRFFQWALIGAVILILSAAGITAYGIYRAADEDAKRPRGPGETAFEMANRRINSGEGPAATGNSAAAIQIAAAVSQTMKALREENFERSKRSSSRRDEFRTYCDLRADQCIILLHVPELRHFNSDAQEALAFFAWDTAQKTLKAQNAGRRGMTLAVGVRGITFYDRVLVGKFLPNYSKANSGLLSVEEGAVSKQHLFPLFEHTTQPAPTSRAGATNRTRLPR